MKKLVGLTYGLAAIAAISATVASANYIVGKGKIEELERAARLQNLAVIAVKNNDYSLACKAQNEAEDALVKAHTKARDVVGMLYQSSNDLCKKANKVIAQN
jgi:hypothetical protein